MTLLFVTSNVNKIKEIKSILPRKIQLVRLEDVDFYDEIPETSDTIEGNSRLKVEAVVTKMGVTCFAEDTGLEIKCLNGEPGVRTARYAGEKACNLDNISLVLNKMEGISDRSARFKTVLTYFDGYEYISFEGICEGSIALLPKGNDGFGYDPIFIPNGSNATFAELSLEEKNFFSHRKKAFEKFLLHLSN
jgi:XTP/dITP diphosphohydrolase